MTTPESTAAEPIGWHVLAFAAPEPTDWVDYSRSEPLPDAPVGQAAASVGIVTRRRTVWRARPRTHV
jgi:hypothetical protein